MDGASRSNSRGGRTYDIVILDVIGLTPRAHDPGIVESNAGNDIDALSLQCRQILNEARKMLGGAAGGECAGNGENDDFLISPLYRDRSAEAGMGEIRRSGRPRRGVKREGMRYPCWHHS